jgi:hypothetical protein
LFPREIDADKGNFFSPLRRLARQRAARNHRGRHRATAEGRTRQRGAQADLAGRISSGMDCEARSEEPIRMGWLLVPAVQPFGVDGWRGRRVAAPDSR